MSSNFKPHYFIRFCQITISVLFLALTTLSQGVAGNRVLVIVLDGLRPDYVTPELMPNLFALGEGGVVYENHHSVYPTVTRVNSSSISTGAYPASHGLMANSVYFPEITEEVLTTSSVENLRMIEEFTNGDLLTVPSIGEVYHLAGKKVLAVSSADSGGSSFLLNHKGLGGGVIGTGLINPETMMEHVLEILGPVPGDSRPATLRNAWAVNAYLELGLNEIEPDLTFMWLTDPDHTAHRFGIGAPQTDQALGQLDGEIGRILDRHKEMGLEDSINIIVTADHGFSTRDNEGRLGDLLAKHGFSDDVVLVNNMAIYLKSYSDELAQSIVTALQSEPTVGAIFARAASPGEMLGIFPGTFSFYAIHWDHDRAADLLVSPHWNDLSNEHGFRGHVSWRSGWGHGSASPFDIHIKLFLSGPDIKEGLKIQAPSGNVDIAATAYYLEEVEPPATLEGRILLEALVGGPDPETVVVETQFYQAEAGEFFIELSESVVDGKRYFDYAQRDTSAYLVDIPDNALESAIRDTLGKPGDDLTEADLASLTFLTAAELDINDISGLEAAVNLTDLDLSFNQINDLSLLSGLTVLTSLNVEENQISDIRALAGLINLRDGSFGAGLRLQNNLIDVAPGSAQRQIIDALDAIDGLTVEFEPQNLFSISIPDSGLESVIRNTLGVPTGVLNSSDLANLTSLTATFLNIADLSGLETAVNLTLLNLFSNQISDISVLSGLTSLTILVLGSNQISDISSLSGLTNLTFLNLDNNQISDISALAGLINLRDGSFGAGLRLKNNFINVTPGSAQRQNIDSLDAIDGLTVDFAPQNLNIFQGQPINGFPGWRSSSWYMNYNVDSWPWVYHDEHGWQFVDSGSTEEVIFVWDLGLGDWLFINENTYRWEFLFGDNSGWIFTFPDNTPERRYFQRSDDGSLFSVPAGLPVE